MSKINVEQELTELIARFTRLKKALQEEETLSPAQKAAAAIAAEFTKKETPPPALTKEQILVKAREILEQRHAQNLANKLQVANMLGGARVPPQPTAAQQEAWLRQNGFGQEELAKQEANWGNTVNNWLSEVTKPLNARFKSKEEEQAYWDNIKVNGNDRDEGPGY